MQTRTGYAEVNGTRLYYEVAGSGAPLVLVPGFTLDTRAWEPQWGPFGERYEVVRYDRRGFGRSGPVGEAPYSHHEDLRALLDALGAGPAAFVGHSSGGSNAVDFALAYPESTRALVLFGPLLGGYALSPGFAAAVEGLKDTARTWGPEAAKAMWTGLLDFRPAEPGAASSDFLRAIVDGYSAWHWLHDDPVRPLEPPAAGRLGELRAPTLTLLGDRDVPDCHAIVARVREEAPRAEGVVLPGLGHLANLEAPERFNAAVLAFLDRVDG
ncbi:MAG TPA: alpha/beta hydrolase [Longimicrobium sp.]|nr:alpha/beta hydrolase [Longimicrobium sp.]